MTQGDFTLDAATAVGTERVERRLLGRLEFSHIVPGDELATFPVAEYRVSVVRSNPFTFFMQEDYSTRIAIDEVSYSNFGTISISPVPEPSATLLLLMAFGAATVVRRPRYS